MKRIQTPDGVIGFPDDMTDAEIEAALAGQASGPTSTPAVAPLPAFARLPLGGAASLAGGAMASLGLPGTGYEALPNWLAHPSRMDLHGLGLPEWLATPVPESKSGVKALPTFGQMQDASNSLGLTNNPALTPQSLGEELYQKTLAGTGSALPMLAMGAGTVPTLLAGTAGGLGSALGEKAAGPIGGVVGGVAGGLGVGGVAGLLNRFATSPTAVRNIASRLGSSESLEQAGGHAQARAWQWMRQEAPRQIDALWAPVDGPGGYINPATTAVPLHDFEHTLQQLSSRGGSLDTVIQGLPAGSRIQQILRNYTNTPSGALGIAPTWEDVRALRTAIGRAKLDPGIPGSPVEEDLSNLYRAATGDLRAAAHGVAPEAGEAFDNANLETTRLLNFRDSTLKKLVSADTPVPGSDPLPGKAAASLLQEGQKDSTNLTALRRYLPDVADELAAAHIRTSSKWGKLSEESRAALVPSAPDRAVLDSVAEAAPKSKLEAALSHVGTPLTSLAGGALGEEVGHLMSQYGNTFGHFMDSPEMGTNLRLAGAAAPFIYSGLHKLLTNPSALRLPFIGALAGQATGGQPSGTELGLGTRPNP